MSHRLFVGQLVRDVRKRELEEAFDRYGELERVDIKSGYAFVEFVHSRDAEEAMRKMNGQEFLGRRLIVEEARGRKRDRDFDRYDRRGGGERGGGRYRRNNGPERSEYRVMVEGLGRGTSWQDLKDAFRTSGDVCFTDVRRDRNDEYYGIVEFRYRDDIDYAVRKMDGGEVNGYKVTVREDRREKRRRRGSRSPSPRDRRSASPVERRSGSPRDRRSPSKERDERRSPSRERDERRSPSQERDERRSPSQEREERKSPREDREEDQRSPQEDRDRSPENDQGDDGEKNEENEENDN